MSTSEKTMQPAQPKAPKRDATYYREYRAKKKKEKELDSKGKPRGVLDEKRKLAAAAVARRLVENPKISVRKAIREVGLSEHLATHPAKLTNSVEWVEMLDVFLPNGEVLETHRGLLRASHIDHMIFADGPKNEATCIAFLAEKNAKLKPDENEFTRDDVLTDDDIRAMLDEKNCTVRRISRTENSRHVYFWSPDNRARKDALEMVYKLRGSYAADKAAVAFSLAALARARDGGSSAPEELPEAEGRPQLPHSIDAED